MEALSSKILELLICGQKVFLQLDQDALSLKNRFLFALKRGDNTPIELMETLKQDKSNLTHLAQNVMREGFAEKLQVASDKRKIMYALTEKGMEEIDAILQSAEEKLQTIIDDDEEYEALKIKIGEIINLLSFL